MKRSARINLKVLLGLTCIVLLVGSAIAVAHVARKQAIAEKAHTQARAALDRQDWPAACQHLRLYLSKCPDDPEALREFARAQLAIRPREAAQIGAAISAYRQLIRIVPEDPANYARLVQLYVRNGAFHEAVYTAERWQQVAPQDRAAQLWLGKARFYQREFEGANETLAQLVQAAPDCVEAYIVLAAIANRSSAAAERAAASKWLDECVERNPQSAEAYVHRARLHCGLSGWKPEADSEALAARDMRRAEELQPSNPRTWLALCEQWLILDEVQLARSALQRASAADEPAVAAAFDDPDDWVLGVFQLQARLQLHSPDPLQDGPGLAEAALKTLQQRAHRTLAMPLAIKLHVNAGSLVTARAHLHEYEALLPPDPPVEVLDQLPLLHAAILVGEQQWYAVLEQLEPLVARNRELPLAWEMLARAHAATHQPRRAARALNEWLRLDPGNSIATAELLRTFVQSQDWGRALETAALLADGSGAADETRALAARARLRLLSVAAEEVTPETAGGEEAELKSLRDAQPEQVEIRLLLAALYESGGDAAAAQSELLDAIASCADPLPARLQLAQLLSRTGQYAQALEMAEQACLEHPTELGPWAMLSEVQVREGCVGDARTTLAQAEGMVEGRERADLALRRSRLELAYGDAEAAEAVLRATATDDGDPRIHMALLELNRVRSDRAFAAGLIDALRRIEGASGLRWRYASARQMLAEDDWASRQQEIAENLKYCIDADPGWNEPVIALGSMFERLFDWSSSEELYRRGMQNDAGRRTIALPLLALLERQGRFSDVQALLAELPKDPGLSSHRLGAALSAGNLEDATKELEARVARSPGDAEARVMLANLTYRHSGDAARASALLDEAERIAPDSPAVVAARVWILHDQGQPTEARTRLDEFVERTCTFESYVIRGGYLASAGEDAAAEADYRRSAEMGAGGTGYELLGGYLADKERMDEAIAAWEEGLGAHPDNQRLARLLARARFARNGPDDAARGRTLLDSLAEKSADDPEVLWLRARTLMDSTDAAAHREAEALLQHVIRIQPAAADAHLALVRICMAREEYAAARDRALQAEAVCGGEPRLLLARAQAELALNHAPLARMLIRTVLANDRDSTGARDLLVELALSTGEPDAIDEADVLLERAIARQPGDAQLTLTRAIILQRQGRAADAIVQLEAYSRERGPAPAKLLVHLADLLREAGRLPQALARIEEAAALAPGDPDVERARMRWLAADGQFDQLAAGALASVRQGGPNVDSILLAARLLEQSGSTPHTQRAAEVLAALVAAAPEELEPRLQLAWHALQNQDVDTAERAYLDVLALDADNVQALNNLAWLLAERRGDGERALPLIERAVKIQPAGGHILDTYATVLAAIPERTSDARRVLEKCVELASADSQEQAAALLRLARVCEVLGDFEAQRRHLADARALDTRTNVLSAAQRAELAAHLEGGAQ